MNDPLQLAQLEQQYNLPQGLLPAVMSQESRGNPNAVSPAGALGAFQFMPKTAQAYGIDPLDPLQASVGAARMFSDLSKQYGGDVPKMLAAYNWGSGNLAKYGMNNAPQETRDYIAKIAPQVGGGNKQYAQTDTGIMSDASQITPEMAQAELARRQQAAGGDITPEMAQAELARRGVKFGETPQDNGPSYFDKVAESYASAVKPAAAKLMAPFLSDQQKQDPFLILAGDLPSGKPKTFAQSVNQGPIGAAAGALQSFAAPIAPLVGDLASYAAKQLGATPSQMENAQALMNIATPASMAGLGKSLGNLTVTDAANAAKSGLSKLPAIGEDSKGGFPTFDKPGVPSYDPIAGMKAMAEKYAANKDVASNLYAARDAVAAGKPVDTSGLAEGVGGLINDIKADPFHEARSALPKLQALQDKLEATIPETTGKPTAAGIPQQGFPPVEKFDLADAADLKRVMNESFNQSRWTQNAKGTVYGNLGSKVDSILKDAATKYPEFGQAQNLANKFWLNNVQNAFQDNAVLSKYFKPDDLREIQSLADGRTVALHPETVKRANSTLKNIKSAEDLNAIRLILPPEMAQQLSSEVVKKLGSSGRLQSLGKTITGALDVRPHGIARTVSNIADVVGGVQRTPEQLALIKAAKSPAPQLSTIEELAKSKK